MSANASVVSPSPTNSHRNDADASAPPSESPIEKPRLITQ
jgi:hypothetical protein